MLKRADDLGHTDPEHYVWCASQHHKYDPTKPASKWDGAWRSLRNAAGLPGFRFHDLRHTFASWARQAGAEMPRAPRGVDQRPARVLGGDGDLHLLHGGSIADGSVLAAADIRTRTATVLQDRFAQVVGVDEAIARLEAPAC